VWLFWGQHIYVNGGKVTSVVYPVIKNVDIQFGAHDVSGINGIRYAHNQKDG
jgi:hypothetical protein